MKTRIAVGVVIGLLIAGVLAAVGWGAYVAGMRAAYARAPEIAEQMRLNREQRPAMPVPGNPPQAQPGNPPQGPQGNRPPGPRQINPGPGPMMGPGQFGQGPAMRPGPFGPGMMMRDRFASGPMGGGRGFGIANVFGTLARLAVFALVILGIVVLAMRLLRPQRPAGGPVMPPPGFDEWHRRAHAEKKEDA